MSNQVDERTLTAIRSQLAEVGRALPELGPVAALWEQGRDIFQFSSPNVRTSLEKSREIHEKLTKLLEQPKCKYDDTVLALAKLLKELPAAQRPIVRKLIGETQRSALSPYVTRADWQALEEKSAERLLSGLIIQALVLPDDVEDRDVMVALAPSHLCAKRLGLDTINLFDEAAAFAGRDAAQTFRTFSKRQDVTLEAFGLEYVETPHGVRIRQRPLGSI